MRESSARSRGMTILLTACMALPVSFVVTSQSARAAIAASPALASSHSSPVSLEAISCPTASVCTAVGGETNGSNATPAVILRTTDGGKIWVRQTPPTEILGLTTISCPTVAFCLATGGPFQRFGSFDTVTTSDGGATWRETMGTGYEAYVDTVDCRSPVSCYAEGVASSWGRGTSGVALLHTSDAGMTWSTLALPEGKESGSTPDVSLACPTATTCYVARAIGSTSEFDVFKSADGGRTETTVLRHVAGVADTPIGIACWTARACMVVGAGKGARVLVTSAGGAHWVSRPLPRGALDGVGVQCPTPKRCVVIATTLSGVLAARTSNAAVTWATSAVAAFWPVVAAWVVGPDCATATTCRVLVQTNTPAWYAMADQGAKWKRVSIP